MAVGGKSMLSTSNYHARKFGVRAATPGYIALKLCPNLIIVPPRFPAYIEASKKVQAVLAQYDPNFSASSLDEATLDLTDYLAAQQIEKRSRDDTSGDGGVSRTNIGSGGSAAVSGAGGTSSSAGGIDAASAASVASVAAGIAAGDAGGSVAADDDCSLPTDALSPPTATRTAADAAQLSPAEIAVNEMREKIFLATELTASAGIAPNRMLAKVCSDMNKPNGQYYLPPTRTDVLAFIKDLHVRKISGIGTVTVLFCFVFVLSFVFVFVFFGGGGVVYIVDTHRVFSHHVSINESPQHYSLEVAHSGYETYAVLRHFDYPYECRQSHAASVGGGRRCHLLSPVQASGRAIAIIFAEKLRLLFARVARGAGRTSAGCIFNRAERQEEHLDRENVP